MRCKPYIEAALRQGDGGHTLDDVAWAVEAGDAQFWAGLGCAVVTEIVTKPRLRLLNYWLIGGDLRELLTLRPHIEAWGAANGCGRAIGGGICEKRGWARVLAATGYRPRWTIYSKELSA